MRYYVSFGVQYATEAHPSFASGRVPAMRYAHPDNWIEVEAPTELAARQLVNRTLGNNAWSNMYDEAGWQAISDSDRARWYPGRCIALFAEDGVIEQ